MRKSKSRAVAKIQPAKQLRKPAGVPNTRMAAQPEKRMSGAPAQLPGGHQPELRALMLFDKLPIGHGTFLVTEDGSEPHLRRGEYAVIDTTDCEPQHGELYLLQNQGGARRRRAVRVRVDRGHETGSHRIGDDPSIRYWWAGDLRGWRQTSETVHGGIPVFAGLSDGPYATDHLRQKIVGRVVGIANTSLGVTIAPEAGYQDEEACNAAFDPAEYISVMLATGHEPRLCGDMYFEGAPRLTDKQHEAVMAVRYKFCAASTALKRVKAECIKRGLVDRQDGWVPMLPSRGGRVL